MLLQDTELILPREKLAKFGAESLSDEELLAIILQTGTRKEHVLDLAKRVYLHIKKEHYVSYHTLCSITGIGSAKAAKITASMILGKRFEQKRKPTKIKHAKDVFLTLQDMCLLEQEECRILLLNTRNELFKEICIGKGTLDATIIHPRDVFKDAIRNNASKIIVVHNHPSGNPEPSNADKEVTQQLLDASKIVGIELLDHVILGDTYFSFQEQGLL